MPTYEEGEYMNIDEIYHKLRQHTSSISFNPPAMESYISAFENDNSMQLPKSFRELLKLFNGGEIYSLGTRIYGIDKDDTSSFLRISQTNRTNLKIPENYYIIAKLNYGDYICLNFLPPYDVIQWDSAKKRRYLSWNSLDMWLESILNFGYTSIESNTKYDKQLPKEEHTNVHSRMDAHKKRKIKPIILLVLPIIFISVIIFYKVGSVFKSYYNNTSTYLNGNGSKAEKTSTASSAQTSDLINGIDNYMDSEQSIVSSSNDIENDFNIGIVNTQNDPLNVRRTPSTNSEIIGKVQKGENITIIGSYDDWYEIKYGEQTGYVSKIYVLVQGESNMVSGIVVTEKDPLNVRKEASIDSEKIGEVSKGATISITGSNGDWYEIEYGEQTGYVSKQYVELINQISPVVSECQKRGTINSNGAKYVYSYTTEYVCYGGKKVEERLDLEHGWHITAKYICSAYDLTWYEVWDTDDGDYYGWVDGTYISFY